MTIYLPQLAEDDVLFPSIDTALDEPNGLLAFGGDLSVERLINAYRHGIFPWFSEDDPLLWWSPDPRAMFDPTLFKPSKSLKKFLKKSDYTVSLNLATAKVIELCATSRGKDETWITLEMQHAYQQWAAQGGVHSVEVWQDNSLIGGLYGVAVGQLFCGESMFSLRDNASKIALWLFCQHFSQHQGVMIDCQMMNPHLASLGAQEISKREFQKSLLKLRDKSVTSHCYTPQWLYK